MEKEDWALFISLGSFAVAFGSLMWNVWSKFIYPKPKIKVRLWVTDVFAGDKATKCLYAIDLSNHGPGRVVIERIVIQKHSGFLWRNHHTVNVEPTLRPNPWLLCMDFEREFPKAVDVGEALTLYFDFSMPGYDSIGVLDSFGRIHYVGRRNLKNVQRSWEAMSTTVAAQTGA